MNKKSLLKIGTIILLIAVIFVQAYRIQAMSFSELAGNAGNEIPDENGVTSGLNQTAGNNAAANNAADNNAANNAGNNAVNKAGNNAANNAANKAGNKNTSLPQTGTNENIIISLIVIFAGIGVYTFKKVRDYNI